jgi:glucose-1-phosphate thymidylyltransferase
LWEQQAAECPAIVQPVLAERPRAAAVLAINARLVPAVKDIEAIYRAANQCAQEGRWAVVQSPQGLIAALLSADGCPPKRDRAAVLNWLTAAAGALPPMPVETGRLLEYPHDIVRWHTELLPSGLAWQLQRGQSSFHELRQGLFVADGVRLPESYVADASDGPIVIEGGVSIGPYAVLHGPLWIGSQARVMEHAVIKGGVSLGATTKIGGEVFASIVESYTNKQHHGFLGHSYVGSWVNLGAGTCNSDLKNTYGTVNMEYGDQKVSSGLQFMGCIIGDYTKTAVNTSIFTGKVLGVGSMVYGYVTSNVPSFTNYARTFGQMTELAPEILAETQRRMFQRRQVDQRPYHVQLLRAMYELTRNERNLAARPLSF